MSDKGFHNLLSSPTDDDWKLVRKAVAPVFSFVSMRYCPAPAKLLLCCCSSEAVVLSNPSFGLGGTGVRGNAKGRRRRGGGEKEGKCKGTEHNLPNSTKTPQNTNSKPAARWTARFCRKYGV